MDKYEDIVKQIKAAKTPAELGLAIERALVYEHEKQSRKSQFKEFQSVVDSSNN